MRIVAFPRDLNPYQELLYAEMRLRGDEVRYVGELSGSRTLNLLLLPLELALLRLRGYRVFHLHWTFGFGLPGYSSVPGARRLARLWFGLVLSVLRLLGLRLAWTVHNVLPHDPVFDDDVAARRTLVAASSLVIAHSTHALESLAGIGAPAGRSVVIPHGPMSPTGIDDVAPVAPHTPRTIAFLGRVTRYKGVEDLLDALDGLDVPLRCRVAGACEDGDLAEHLRVAGERIGKSVSVELGYLQDTELVQLLAECDVVVYPFRAITTSGSLMLALAAGRPVLIPALGALQDVPDAAAFRYPPGVDGLRSGLREVALASDATLRQRGLAARAASGARSWPAIAAETHAAFAAMLTESSGGPLLAPVARAAPVRRRADRRSRNGPDRH